MPHEKKRDYISYLFEKAASAKGRGFARYYRDALETICSTDDDLLYWRELAVIPDDTKDVGRDELAELLRMRDHTYGQMGMYAETAALLEGHYSLDADICIRHLRALRQAAEKEGESGDSKGKGRDAAARAIEAFPDNPEVLEAAYALFGDGDGDDDSGGADDRARILERLYAITGDWNHIIRLKRVLPDWDGGTVNQIISRLADSSPKHAAALCIKEDMHEKAMGVLEAAADIELLASYRSKMARKIPERYAECYADLLFRFAGSKSGKDHYKRVQNHLSALKELPGGGGDGRYESLLGRIRKEYSGRRTLIKELAKL